jgi:hypothetical protein
MSRRRYGYRNYGYGYRNSYNSYGDEHESRVARAFSQTLQLLQCRFYSKSNRVEVQISSSTGDSHYDLTFHEEGGDCSCPDFERRQAPCKHMLCVLLRVLRLKDKDYSSVEDVGESYDHISQSFLSLFQRTAPATNDSDKDDDSNDNKKKHKTEEESGGEAARAEAKGADESAATTEITSTTAAEQAEDEMCIICLLEFQPNQTDPPLTQCSAQCKRWLGHRDCLKHWYAKSSLCPLCKGVQHLPKVAALNTYRKRARYDGDLDLEALQNESPGAAVGAHAFFEIVDA